MRSFLVTCLCLALATPVVAQSPKTYQDGDRGEVTLPLGDLSFADRVVDFDLGTRSSSQNNVGPETALGPPNYAGQREGGAATMGCNGTLTLQFTDNALVDIEGPDLYVFEIGGDVEPMELAVSSNGEDWIELGRIEGGQTQVDLAGRVAPGDTFAYVRLTDLATKCSGRWPGADVDAVAAIGSATRFTLDGSVLFDVDSAALRPEAAAALDALAADLAAASVSRYRVVGHTDATGSDAYNQSLSEARAFAVRDYLAASASLIAIEATAQGAGESQPAASNATEEGRAANRRVEIIATSQ